jgi:DNA-binding MarR family transcriptional regulator
MGLISKSRSPSDERAVKIHLSPAGLAMEEAAKNIPFQLAACANLNQKSYHELFKVLASQLEQLGVPAPAPGAVGLALGSG